MKNWRDIFKKFFEIILLSILPTTNYLLIENPKKLFINFFDFYKILTGMLLSPVFILFLRNQNIGEIKIPIDKINLSTEQIKKITKINLSILVIGTIILIVAILTSIFTNFINSITNPSELFNVTLTSILIYATFSLLSFTYALVLKNDQNEGIIKVENSTSILPEKEIDFENSIEIRIKNEIMVRKSGESFLMATILVVIGIVMIYVFIAATKLFTTSFDGLLSNNYITILIPIYFGISLSIIFYSFLHFFNGIILLIKSIFKNIII